MFSELVIIVTSYAVTKLPHDLTVFEELREMCENIPFKLVFSLEVSDSYREEARRELTGVLNSVSEKGFLDFLASPPTIRIARPRYCVWDLLDFD
jgi:hypothetical protein